MNKEDLKEYKYNRQWIKGRLEYIEEYKTNITNITAALSDMPSGSRKVQDNMAEKLSVLIDTINDLLDKVVKESQKQKVILEQLDKIEQPYKLILEKVYIQGKSLVTVASEMGYDYKYICKMNGIALNKFDNTTKEVL
jgi:DNA-directed RNA polymerase specialized sigma subunit